MDNIASGMRVKVVRLGTTDGMLIHDKHLKIREVGKVGIVTNLIPGHGGDVWGVQQDNGQACYCYDELEEVTEKVADNAIVKNILYLVLLFGGAAIGLAWIIGQVAK